MQTELDRLFDGAIKAHMVPGGMLEVAPLAIARFGTAVPALVRAPPALPHFFAHFCHQHADAEFLVDGDLRLTFAQTYALARQMAGGLVAGHGVQPGEFVGLAARNSTNWIIAYMAILMAGGCATLLNGWWQGEEMGEGIALGPCRLVIADDERAARLEGIAHGATILPLSHDCPPEQGLAALIAKGGDADTALPPVGPEDKATMLFTSGSTGRCKGALSDQRAVLSGAINYAAQTLGMFGALDARGQAPTGQPIALVPVPLFHVTGEVPLMLQSFIIGRKLVMMAKWDAKEAMRLIEAEGVTYFVGVPLMSREIATHPERDSFDLTTCQSFVAGGAPRPPEHVAQLKERLPGFPVLGYGLTETNAVGCGNFNENYLAKPASTGRASAPLVELAILDDMGQPLPQGQIGEVGIRSICNFIGYWRNDEATREAVTADGFLLTGDLGRLDEDGYLFIVDRKKDIIIRGGENISCIEVEDAIYAHPEVAEASVFGLADDRLGEVPGAVYVARPGSTLEPAALSKFLAERLAPYKLPAQVWCSKEALPRLGTEKVDKRSLRDRYA